MLNLTECMELLPGLDQSYPDDFCYLARLLGQEQFELLDTEAGLRDRRVVYLMNDTVESWFVLKDCRYTGMYDPDYEGEMPARISREDRGFVLVLLQGENAVTFFFSDLELKVQLYDYGDVGHFWVKGYEYLRLIEYHIAIIYDKLEYLGEEYCTDGEKRIAALKDFPPLGYVCYPAAPMKYVVGKDDPWHVSQEAGKMMMEIALQAGDVSFARALKWYIRWPAKLTGKWIAHQLHKKRHIGIALRLQEIIRTEGSKYLPREYGSDLEQEKQSLLKKAQKMAAQMPENGMKPRIVREEPFVLADDGIEMSVYIMTYKLLRDNVECEVLKVRS